MIRSRIIATGSYVPPRILTNFDLEKMVDTSDEWIRSRSGIGERRIVEKDVVTSDLGTQAALRALEMAGLSPGDLDLIICGTNSPDMFFPCTGCFIQAKIGAKKAAAFDVSAGCTSFIHTLSLADKFIKEDPARKVMVLGAEIMSKVTDWSDRATCVLFGDGAGAAVLKHRGSAHGVIASHIGSDGQFSDILFMPGGGSRCPITKENADQHLNTIHMLGNEVYKQAVIAMLDASRKALEKAGLTTDDIACVIPHQANLRIIEAIADRLKIPSEKVYVNLDKYGNTSAAAVAIALDEANRSGRIKPGDFILMVVFGGGLTWASTVIEW